jgi:hypothetical protein
MSLANRVLVKVLLHPKDGPYLPSRCETCKHMRPSAGGCHISCASPDPDVTGKPHGIAHGWFNYPLDFDPVWMTTQCTTYEAMT